MVYFSSHPEYEARIFALENAIQDQHFDIRTVKPLPTEIRACLGIDESAVIPWQ